MEVEQYHLPVCGTTHPFPKIIEQNLCVGALSIATQPTNSGVIIILKIWLQKIGPLIIFLLCK